MSRVNGGGQLGALITRKGREVQRRRAHTALARCWQTQAAVDIDAEASIAALLRRPAGAPPRVIGEIKRRSPSAGTLRPWERGDVASIARAYVDAGATAVSVLCDADFGGTPLDVRRAVRACAVPVLYKEFVLHPVQLDAARALGASLVLLLACVLDDSSLSALMDACRARGLAPLVEIANEDELRRVLRLDPRLIGVNARDLRTFEVDPREAERLVAMVPAERIVVYMSGVRERADFERVAASRADAVLVGEGLMRAPSPGAKLREISGTP